MVAPVDVRRSMRVRLTTLLASSLAIATLGCSARPHAIRWPAASLVSLESALARSATAPRARESDAAPPAIRPPELPDAPNVHARASDHEGLWYAEVVLGDVDPDAALPLVVMLHGRGDRPFLPGGPFGGVPTPMRIVIPRGPLPLGEGFAWVPYRVGENRPRELADALAKMSDRLARLIAHVRQERETLGSPVITGFSQGGLLAWATALRHPAAVGLAMPMAAWVPPALMPSRIGDPAGYPAMRALHGTEDPTVPIAPTRDVVTALRALGLQVEWIEFEGVGHVMTPEMNALFEAWLEEALAARAPSLAGGPGHAGPEPEPYLPYEELDVPEDMPADPDPDAAADDDEPDAGETAGGGDVSETDPENIASDPDAENIASDPDATADPRGNETDGSPNDAGAQDAGAQDAGAQDAGAGGTER